MRSSFESIQEKLVALGRAERRSISWLVGKLSGAAWLATLTLALISAHVGWIRISLWLLWGGTALIPLCAIIYLKTRIYHKSRHTLAEYARRAERLHPSYGTSLTSAVSLSTDAEKVTERFSIELIHQHLDAAASTINDSHWQNDVVAAGLLPRRRAHTALIICCLVFGLSAIFLGTGRSRLFTFIANPNAARLSDAPLAGDIQLIYHSPTYTGLPPRTVEGGDGNIEAVTGTEVELSAKADRPVRRAFLRIESPKGEDTQELPMHVVDERLLSTRLPIVRDGRYFFVLIDTDGDKIEDRNAHVIRALADVYPEIVLSVPATDIELRDKQTLELHWQAHDDFGLSELNLIVESPQNPQPTRIPIALPPGPDPKRRDGRYQWSLASLNLTPGSEIAFHLEIADNDIIAGPKRAVSATRRLTLYSAQKHHEALLAKEREALDGMVDWLGADLIAPFPKENSKERRAAIVTHKNILAQIGKLEEFVQTLVTDIGKDPLSKPEIATAFTNILEHIAKAHRDRSGLIENSPFTLTDMPINQQRHISQNEKDIIYLDDLLALARIDELKNTAQDLLAAQRDLRGLLNKYAETKDPALRAELQNRIREMRQNMLDLLAKMSDIKKTLPGEYRNLESASMVKLDDQLGRLEKLLSEGNVEAAAAELEQLANMVENMVQSIDKAEDEYGGERYKEAREQLSQFANKFEELENSQKALSEQTEQLLKQYRQKAVEQSGKNMQELADKARKLVKSSLSSLDTLANEHPAADRVERELESTRQNLLDLDNLLQHRDFAEARQIAQDSESNNDSLVARLYDVVNAASPAQARDYQTGLDAGKTSQKNVRSVRAMLDKLFPEPSQVLNREQMAQLERMSQKQQQMREQANSLEEQMQKLEEQVPLFGGESQSMLGQAKRDMQQAQSAMQQGALPDAASGERRITEQLGKLRKSLEEASKNGGGGLPLPLGNSQSGSSQNGKGGGQNSRPEDVEIPRADNGKDAPKFRQELMEAAKQKAPVRYEEAVRQYYEELIR